jgi:hypothetical protein
MRPLPTPLGSTSCYQGICLQDLARGACCIEVDGECTESLQLSCLVQGGTWLGPDTSCEGNPCRLCPSDSNGDGVVGINDFLDLLATWGPCPSPP